MPVKCELEFKIHDSPSSKMLVAEFADEEWNRIKEFSECASELLACKFASGASKVSLQMDIDRKEKKITHSVKLPLWDDVIVFLHRLRPLYLNNENANFNRVCKLLKSRFDDPEFRVFIKQEQHRYEGKLLRKQVEIRTPETVVNSEQALAAWLNVKEYHREKDYRKTLIEKIEKAFPEKFMRGIFVLVLLAKLDAIRKIAKIVDAILNEGKSYQI